MTRVTFQFVPVSYIDLGDVTLQDESLEDLEVYSPTSGVTIAETEDARIEFDNGGNIRYTVEKETISGDIVEETFEKATTVLDSVLEKDEHEYRVSLIIGEMDSFDQYTENRGDISEFGVSQFCSEDPKYTELNDEAVKISFSDDGKSVVV